MWTRLGRWARCFWRRNIVAPDPKETGLLFVNVILWDGAKGTPPSSRPQITHRCPSRRIGRAASKKLYDRVMREPSPEG